jgi:hypothetical protein
MDVDDLDLKSADESDLTVQAPPVALKPSARTDALARALGHRADAFHATLDTAQRDSALDRLRRRPRA